MRNGLPAGDRFLPFPCRSPAAAPPLRLRALPAPHYGRHSLSLLPFWSLTVKGATVTVRPAPPRPASSAAAFLALRPSSCCNLGCRHLRRRRRRPIPDGPASQPAGINSYFIFTTHNKKSSASFKIFPPRGSRASGASGYTRRLSPARGGASALASPGGPSRARQLDWISKRVKTTRIEIGLLSRQPRPPGRRRRGLAIPTL